MKIWDVIRHNGWVLEKLRKCAPRYVAMSLIVALLVAADNVVCNAYLIRFIYSTLAEGQSITRVFVALGLTGVLLVVRFALRAYTDECLKPRAQIALTADIQNQLMTHAQSADLSEFDDPAHHRDVIWAMENAEKRAMDVFETSMRLFATLLMAGGFVSLVIQVDWVMLVLALMYALATFGFGLRQAKIAYQKDQVDREDIGQMRYAHRLFFLPQYAKELRTTNIAQCINAKCQVAMERLSENGARFGKRRAVLMLLEDIVNEQVLLNACVYGRLIWRLLVEKSLPMGDFLAVAFAVEQTTWRLGDLFSIFPEFVKSSLYIGQVCAFLEKRPSIREVEAAVNLPKAPARIELHDLTFAYPGAQSPVFDKFNLTIWPGEKLALVGVNGAGKTTLTKLLLRLYEPNEGSILINGEPIEQYKFEDLHHYIGTVRQNVQLYAATLAQNIAMSETTPGDTLQISNALDKVGFEKRSLEAEVTRLFDEQGLMFSGGEAQKLALARLFAALPEVCLLDEPSAALDPIAEAELNRSMLDQLKGKTVVLISHRLSTTRFCDRIAFIKDGRIAEQGTHDELMQQNGDYAQMFRKQSERYL